MGCKCKNYGDKVMDTIMDADIVMDQCQYRMTNEGITVIGKPGGFGGSSEPGKKFKNREIKEILETEFGNRNQKKLCKEAFPGKGNRKRKKACKKAIKKAMKALKKGQISEDEFRNLVTQAVAVGDIDYDMGLLLVEGVDEIEEVLLKDEDDDDDSDEYDYFLSKIFGGGDNGNKGRIRELSKRIDQLTQLVYTLLGQNPNAGAGLPYHGIYGPGSQQNLLPTPDRSL